VTDWAVGFLGAIALATLVMAAIQVGAIVYGARLARRVERLVGQVERDIGPLVERLTAMSGDAQRAAALAAAQVEKVDRMTTELSARLDRTMALVQRALVAPAREAAALAAAARAAAAALRVGRRRQAARGLDGDDTALFIG
jgi:hypothetical protein